MLAQLQYLGAEALPVNTVRGYVIRALFDFIMLALELLDLRFQARVLFVHGFSR